VSDPTRPQQLGRSGFFDQAFSLELSGTLLFASTDDGNRIIAYDVSEPAAPENVGRAETSDYRSVYDLHIVGNHILAATGSDGLTVIQFDPNNPGAPWSTVRQIDLPLGGRAVTVRGTRAYVTSAAGGLYIFDISAIANPTLLGSFATPGRSPDVRLAGDLALVADGDSLEILNVRTPAAIERVGRYATWEAEDVVLDGERAYVAAGPAGLRIIDRTRPSALVELGSVPALSSADEVVVSGTVAYVLNGMRTVPGTTATVVGGLQIVDVTSASAPAVQASIPISDARQVDVEGRRAYVAAADGLYVFDVALPAQPQLLGHVPPEPFGEFYLVQVIGTQAYAIGGSGYTLAIYDLGQPASPTLLGGITAGDDLQRLKVDGDRVYLLDDNDTLYMLDVRDPARIQGLGSLRVSETLRRLDDLEIVDGLGIVSGSFLNQGLLTLVDLRGATPQLLGSSEVSGFARGLASDGRLLYLAAADGGLQTLRLRRDLLPVAGTIPASGGEIRTDDGSFTFALPPGALDATLVVSYTGLVTPTQPFSDALPLRSFALEGRAPNGKAIAGLAAAYTLTLTYDQADLALTGIDETQLNLYRWDGSSWRTLLPCTGCVLDYGTNTLRLKGDAFGEYVLAGEPGTGVDVGVRVLLPVLLR
jgi:hypothetical protein